jgi:hypothetical protein
MRSINGAAVSKAAARRASKGPIFCVGWHAFVNGPDPAALVALAAAGGPPIVNDLADGQEVEILSWHPRSRIGLAYQIRRLSDGSEWWIASTHLRRERHAAPMVNGARPTPPVSEHR